MSGGIWKRKAGAAKLARRMPYLESDVIKFITTHIIRLKWVNPNWMKSVPEKKQDTHVWKVGQLNGNSPATHKNLSWLCEPWIIYSSAHNPESNL